MLSLRDRLSNKKRVMPGQRWVRFQVGGAKLAGRCIDEGTRVTVIAVTPYGEALDTLLLTDSGTLGWMLFVPEFWELVCT